MNTFIIRNQQLIRTVAYEYVTMLSIVLADYLRELRKEDSCVTYDDVSELTNRVDDATLLYIESGAQSLHLTEDLITVLSECLDWSIEVTENEFLVDSNIESLEKLTKLRILRTSLEM